MTIIHHSFAKINNHFKLTNICRYGCALALCFALLACHSTPQDLSIVDPSLEASTYTKLAPSDFARKLSEIDNEILIDVRTSDEYSIGHLAGATVLDFRAADFRQRASRLDHHRPVMIYCAAGGRSSAAVNVLRELGFTDIYELQGGLTSWVGEGRAITK